MNEKINELNKINKQITELEGKRKKIKKEIKQNIDSKDIEDLTEEEMQYLCSSAYNDEEVPF